MEDTALTRAELRTWRRFMVATTAVFDALHRDLRDHTGLSLDDLSLLMPVWDSGQRGIRMGELADRTNFSQSRVSHAVRRMEAVGWVTREPSPADGRVKLVRLTPKGVRLFADAWPRHSQRIREVFLDPLEPNEREMISRISATIHREATRTT